MDSGPLFHIGAAKIDITPDALGTVMLGWADHDHVVRGVATRLYARAIVLVAPNGVRSIFLCLEVGFISEAIRRAVVDRLGVAEEEIMISATHTHSAPGGISDYLLYSISCNGFNPATFETYVAGAVEAVRSAIAAAIPGRARFSSGIFPDDQPVAFNRAIRAYNRNPEVEPRGRSERHLAVDREMTLLRFEDAAGRPIAAWNWFPVHGTSMHRDRFEIHSDNKGLAAARMEEHFSATGGRAFVAVFAQGAAGDVSPNFRYYCGLREKRGAAADDAESCRINAEIQAKLAIELCESAAKVPALDAAVSHVLEYRDLSKVEVDSEFADGRRGQRTGPGETGVPQLYGTAEGRGASRPLIFLMRAAVKVCQLYNYFLLRFTGRAYHWPWSTHRIQGTKVRVVSAGVGEIFETGRLGKLIFPGWTHPMVRMLKKWGNHGDMKQRPFTPHLLPIQLLRIGSLAIAAVPAEFTTIAGRRLRTTLETRLRSAGIERVQIQGFANAYSSYVTTPEEYAQQGYEGACTLFGQWTLPAYQTLFAKLAPRLARNESPAIHRPPPPSAEYMKTISSVG